MAAAGPTTIYTYDPAGLVTSIAYPNGTQTTYNYSAYWLATNPTETVPNTAGTTRTWRMTRTPGGRAMY